MVALMPDGAEHFAQLRRLDEMRGVSPGTANAMKAKLATVTPIRLVVAHGQGDRDFYADKWPDVDPENIRFISTENGAPSGQLHQPGFLPAMAGGRAQPLWIGCTCDRCQRIREAQHQKAEAEFAKLEAAKRAARLPGVCPDCHLDTLPGETRCYWCQQLADLVAAKQCTGDVVREGPGMARCERERAPGDTLCKPCRKVRVEAAHTARWDSDTWNAIAGMALLVLCLAIVILSSVFGP